MEEILQASVPAPVLCGACFKHVTGEDSFCDGCGYPLKGTEQEQKYFISVRDAKEIDLESALKKIKRAGHVLYWVAGGTLLMGLIIAFTSTVPEERANLLIVNTILAAVYAGLGFWSQKKPFAGIISGFALYMIILILNAIINPLSIASGIIIKIIFIGYFINGIRSVIEAEKLKKELNIE
jgi:hypothetical protein